MRWHGGGRLWLLGRQGLLALQRLLALGHERFGVLA
jgi:hypothetical protein